MAIAIVYLYIIGNADAKAEANICFIISGAWALISIAYIAVTTIKKTYGMKMISAMIRPEQLGIVVDILKDEDLITGMTVTKVKGFVRQKGNTDGGTNSSISFVPKVRVDMVVREWDVPKVMEILREAANTGNVGDGKIFVLDANEAMRVRTGEKGIYSV